ELRRLLVGGRILRDGPPAAGIGGEALARDDGRVRVGPLARRLGAPIAVARGAPEEEGGGGGRRRRGGGGGEGGGGGGDLRHHRAEHLAREGELAGEGAVGDDRERPEIAARIEVLHAAALLGAHVVRRSHELARLGALGHGRAGGVLGDAEVEDLGDLL